MAKKPTKKPARRPAPPAKKTAKARPDKRELLLVKMTGMGHSLARLARANGHRASVAYHRNRDGTLDVQTRMLDWPMNRIAMRDAYFEVFTEATSVVDFNSLPYECRISLDFGASDKKGLVEGYLKTRQGIPSTHSKERIPSAAANLFATSGPAFLDLFKRNRWKHERISVNFRYDPELTKAAQKKRATAHAKRRSIEAKKATKAKKAAKSKVRRKR